MTTNVYDKHAGLMATDSRWSVTYLQYLVYLDDVGFDKIERHTDYAFMFAGFAKRVQEWKTWIRTNPADMSAMPPTTGMAVTVAQISTRAVLHSAGHGANDEGAIFAGTGWFPAYTCWTANKDAKRSIETAKSVDIYSGGEVKHFDLISGSHNLYPGADVTFADLIRNFEKRGLVMKIDDKIVVNAPFNRKKDAEASNDDIRNEVAGKIASGELHPAAPCDGMVREWTQEEKSSFAGALGKVFGWKK